MDVTADLDDYWKAKLVALEKLLEHLARKCAEMGKTNGAFSGNCMVNYEPQPQINKCPLDDGDLESKCEFLTNQINALELLWKKSWPKQEKSPSVEEQQKHPFEICPEEMWKMIADELRDRWDDLYSLSKAHPSLNAVVKPAKTSLRFHQVLGIIFNKLKKRDVLNCRKVCREWTAAIDQFLQFPSSLKCCDVLQLEPPANTSSRPLSHYRAHIPIGQEPYATRVGNVADFQKYSREMADHPRNPFLCHALKFRLKGWNQKNQRDQKTFLESCSTFLNQFGTHVWYLQVDLDEENLHKLLYCKLMVQSLSKLPNLKDLRLRYCFADDEDADVLNEEDFRETREMEAYLEANPLPELPKLVSFRGTYEREILPTLQAAILKRYASQLRHVEVMDGTWNKYGSTMRSLKELHILDQSLERPAFASLFSRRQGKRQISLEKFKDLPVPLDKLCFRFSYEGRKSSKFIDSKIFLQILGHLKTRVCCIQSELRRQISEINDWGYEEPTEELVGWDISGRTNLPSKHTVPSLEMLIINGQDIKLSAYFLRCLTNLRYFYYSPTMTNSLNNKNIVEMKRDSSDSKKVNQWRLIWEAVPSLEVIAVDKKYFSKQRDSTIFLF